MSLRIVLGAVADWLWPACCPVCDEEWNAEPGWLASQRTGLPLAHSSCVRRIEPASRRGGPHPAGAVPVHWAFRDTPEFFRLLHEVKYAGRWDLLELLEPGWVQFARHALEGLSRPVLVPLPDDPDRQRARGGSVVARLADSLEECGLGRSGSRVLVRRRRGAPQARIEGTARRRANVRTLFGVGNLAAISRDRPLILLDDQVTTGATIDAATSLLRTRGHSVRVLALAGAHTAPRWLDP